MSVILGWWCVCVYEDDAPEDEGIVYFSGTPKIGDEFLLPSSRYKETWVVVAVRKDDFSFKAKKKND